MNLILSLTLTLTLSLTLSSPVTDRNLGDQYMLMLYDILADLPDCDAINVRRNNLTDVSMPKLIEVLINRSHITAIDLSENKIEPLTMKALALYLQSSATLSKLILSDSRINDTKLTMFLSSLESNRQSALAELDMSRNEIGRCSRTAMLHCMDDPCVEIAAVLNPKSRIQLKKLDLSWNMMGPSACINIGRELSVNSCLTYLDLGHNQVKIQRVKALC